MVHHKLTRSLRGMNPGCPRLRQPCVTANRPTPFAVERSRSRSCVETTTVSHSTVPLVASYRLPSLSSITPDKGFCARGDACQFLHDENSFTGPAVPPPRAPSRLPDGPPFTAPYHPMFPASVPPPLAFGHPRPLPPFAPFPLPFAPHPPSQSQPELPYGHVQPVASRGGLARRGGDKGRFESRGTFDARPRSNTTLVIENIPHDSLNLQSVSDFFTKFGTVTNVSLDVARAKALVSFSTPDEARKAHSSPDVVFGNRFVKVYFQRLDAPDPSSAPETRPRPTPPAPSPSHPPTRQSKILQGAREQEQRLQRQIAQQKELLQKLEGEKTLDSSEKAKIMETLRRLSGELEASALASRTQTPSEPRDPARAALDRELDELSSRSEPAEDYQAKLDALRREVGASLDSRHFVPNSSRQAEELGIDAASTTHTPATWQRGRGYGRGTRIFRGRGASWRGSPASFKHRSFTLDNRSTRINVKSISADADLDRLRSRLSVGIFLSSGHACFG
jgi:RNA-binding protein 26